MTSGLHPRIIVRSRRPAIVRALREAVAGLRPPPETGSGKPRRGEPPPLVMFDLGEDPPHRLREFQKNLPEGTRLVAVVDARFSHRLIDALANGCEDYLFLPIRPRELRLLWRRHLEGDRPVNFLAEEERRESARLEFPSDVAYGRAAVERMLDACRRWVVLDEQETFRVRVALGEAVTNAILYGNEADHRRRVSVGAERTGGELRIRIADEGPGFLPEAVPDPTRAHNLSRSRGRGLFLMRQLADRIDFNDRGNEVTLVFRAPAAAED